MNNKAYGSNVWFKKWARMVGGTALLLFAATAHAGTINLGALSYDTFIPAGGGSPGVFAFDLANLTGVFDLPTDFPVADSLTFGSAMLTLTFTDSSKNIIPLGNIGPGFLVDGSGNPVVQVPGDKTFKSAEFTATLAPLTFALSGGTTFTAASNSIDVKLLPSVGTALTADVDQTTISVSEASSTASPEPGSGALILAALIVLACRTRNTRNLFTKSGN